MTIICATRFTEESSFAVKAAGELALRHKQLLWLVHVLPSGLGAFADRLDSAAAAALDHEAQTLSQAGVNVQTLVLHGKLDQALGRFCRDKSASLLVVGDTAKKVGAVMASTLDKLAYGVETALLVVRDPRPFSAWASGKAPLKVMLGLDHTASSAIARDWITRLAEYGAIDLVASQIWWPLEEYERRGMPLPPAEEGHLEISRLMRAETKAALAGLPSNVKTRVHLQIGVGQVGDELLALANEEQSDLVVLGTHRRRALGRLWSVSHHVLALAPMSVACVPATVSLPDLSRIPTFTTALAATDFSEAGNRAITCAIGLVGNGTVYAVHVSRETYSADQEKGLLKKLASVLPPEAERRGAKVVVHVRSGGVVTELLKASDELAVDVICLGAKPAQAVKGALIDEVIALATRPVLIAPPIKA